MDISVVPLADALAELSSRFRTLHFIILRFFSSFVVTLLVLNIAIWDDLSILFLIFLSFYHCHGFVTCTGRPTINLLLIADLRTSGGILSLFHFLTNTFSLLGINWKIWINNFITFVLFFISLYRRIIYMIVIDIKSSSKFHTSFKIETDRKEAIQDKTPDRA